MAIFSVIIPAYNVERYILSLLKSLSVQNFKDFEVICTDDCSTDKTADIILKFAETDKRIKYIKTDFHQGPGASRNLALKYATGKYIACADADDVVMPDFLNDAYEKLERTKVGSVWIKSLIYWENEKKATPMFTFPKLRDEKEGFLTLTPENLTDYPAYSWNKMFRRELFDDSIFWTPDRLFEDVEFYWRFYTQNPDIYVIDKTLYLYRRHQSSIMSKCVVDVDYHKNLFVVTENIYRFLKEKNLFEKYKKTFLNFVMQNIREFESYDNLRQELARTVLETLKNIHFPEDYEDLRKELPIAQFDFSLH